MFADDFAHFKLDANSTEYIHAMAIVGGKAQTTCVCHCEFRSKAMQTDFQSKKTQNKTFIYENPSE